jgi:hypothetical protein
VVIVAAKVCGKMKMSFVASFATTFFELLQKNFRSKTRGKQTNTL